MKHFRLACCFLATASVALLLIALGRQGIDPTAAGRASAPVAQALPVFSSSSVSAMPASERSDSPAAPSDDRKQVPGAVTPVLPAVPADGDEPRHPGDRVDPAKVVARYGHQPLTAEHKDMKAAIEIQERNNRWLMAHPAVVGTAIGLNDEAEIALIVYTKVDAPELPKSVEGLPVATFRSGPIVARNRLTQDDVTTLEKSPVSRPKPNGGGGSALAPTMRHPRPVPIGVSTGHPDITAGTIGCRVRDSQGAVYALSNNHVYANENNALVGDAVIQPGTFDGGVSPADDIGTLFKFTTLDFSAEGKNTIDAAISLSSEAALGKSTSSAGYGTPKSSPLEAALRKKVKKYGRTTGLTTGNIVGLNATVNVGYDGGTAQFQGQVLISPGSFSAGGDSGSLIVSNDKGADNGRPVGLLFAGSPSITIGNRIQDVLSAFDVTIDGN